MQMNVMGDGPRNTYKGIVWVDKVYLTIKHDEWICFTIDLDGKCLEWLICRRILYFEVVHVFGAEFISNDILKC